VNNAVKKTAKLPTMISFVKSDMGAEVFTFSLFVTAELDFTLDL